MRVVDITCHKPANLLVAALQEFCCKLMAEPAQNGIENLGTLAERTWQLAKELQTGFKKCSLENLSFESDHHTTFEIFSLWYKDKSPMISIMARPDSFEQCFREYDEIKKTAKPR